MFAVQSRLTLRRPRGFSLIELIIVIVIIGIIGAIAIPRMSRGAAGAADSAVTANLAILRNAIDLYHTEHGGQYPTFANIVGQLTTYTDDNGNVNAERTSVFIFGPYLRAIPSLPVGPNKGSTTITDSAGTAGFGWVYNEATGEIRANTGTLTDARNIEYRNY
jgi:prepilin-type N-terminal cleavage/methylation domain-containing protein